MYTKKQIEKFEKDLAEGKFKNLKTEPLPDFILPSWLPPEIKELIDRNVSTLNNVKDDMQHRMFYDIYSQLLDYFKRYIIAFTDNSLKEIWLDLYKISKEKTISLAEEITSMENSFDGVVSLYYKHQNEIKSCEKMLKYADKLYDSMDEYHCHYFGHMLQKNHHELMKKIKVFYEKTLKNLKEFKEESKCISDYSGELWPISREYKSENALPIFFIKKFTLYFRKHFTKPMYSYTAEFVNTIFATTYTENEVIKHSGNLDKIPPLHHGVCPACEQTIPSGKEDCLACPSCGYVFLVY